MEAEIVYIVLAAVFGIFMAWGIGANDVANAMATSVGSRALTIKQAILVAAVFEFLGAVLAGGEVTSTIRKGIVDADLLKRITVHARSLPAIDRPVVRWQPTQAAPAVGQVSQALQARWQRRAVRAQTAYIATARASQIFGGKTRGELKNPLQATHDLGVAAVWLHFDAHKPELADAWQGEDLMAHTRRGEKCPDAFIVDEAGEVMCVVEFGGAYDAERVRAFHHDCASRGLAYQIW